MRTSILLLLTVCTCALQEVVFGQSIPRGYLTVQPDSLGSYWRVLTSARLRDTRVQFYGNDHALLYEEVVPEKWIKQNKRNRRRLDRLLAEIEAGMLILSRLKTEELPPEPVLPTPPGDVADVHAYQIHVSANAEGKIRVAINNPESVRCKIEIADYRGQIVYYEFTTIAKYRRLLDISPIAGDMAQVILSMDKKRLVYNIRREASKQLFTVRPVVAHR